MDYRSVVACGNMGDQPVDDLVNVRDTPSLDIVETLLRSVRDLASEIIPRPTIVAKTDRLDPHREVARSLRSSRRNRQAARLPRWQHPRRAAHAHFQRGPGHASVSPDNLRRSGRRQLGQKGGPGIVHKLPEMVGYRDLLIRLTLDET